MKKILFELKQIIITAFRLLYVFISGGESCAICGKKVFTRPVCKECMARYFSVKKIMELERCRCCGKVLICLNGKCSVCRENPVLKSTDSVLPLFSYRLWNKELMFRWKMQDERRLSPIFASLLAQALRLAGETFIVPVPPRKGKIRKKGWDQIDELCTFLERRYGFKVLKILERKSSQQQKKLSRAERLEHIKNSYVLKVYSGTLPESICLIDDVCTTGSTLESCASVLKAAGIKRVNAITLFSVD